MGIETKNQGSHSIERHAVDVIVYRLRGVLDGPELAAMMEHQAAWQGDLGYLLVVIDVREFSSPTVSALRLARDTSANMMPRGVSIFGARFATRTLVDVLFRAKRALSGGALRYRFFETEAECLAWLDAARPDVVALMNRNP